MIAKTCKSKAKKVKRKPKSTLSASVTLCLPPFHFACLRFPFPAFVSLFRPPLLLCPPQFHFACLRFTLPAFLSLYLLAFHFSCLRFTFPASVSLCPPPFDFAWLRLALSSDLATLKADLKERRRRHRQLATGVNSLKHEIDKLKEKADAAREGAQAAAAAPTDGAKVGPLQSTLFCF
jgi:hypothetical protein